jgi:hypothetical protein
VVRSDASTIVMARWPMRWHASVALARLVLLDFEQFRSAATATGRSDILKLLVRRMSLKYDTGAIGASLPGTPQAPDAAAR